MSSESTFGEHLNLKAAQRSQKPRIRGITMVIDTGWPWRLQESILEADSASVDVVKIVDGHLHQPLSVVKQKIKIFHEHDVAVQPGGIIIEIARWQNKGIETLEKLRELGFDQVEVSSSATERREMNEEARFAQEAKKLGFHVFGEVGKKFSEGDESRSADDEIDVGETVREMKALLAAGSEKIYWEGHLLRRVMGETPAEILARREIGTPQIQAVVDQIGADKIVFEVSGMVGRKTRRAMHFWLIHLFGPDVNIGNARIEELMTIEMMRGGTYPVFGFGPAGDHPWIQALARGGGEASPEWWKEAAVYPTPACP